VIRRIDNWLPPAPPVGAPANKAGRDAVRSASAASFKEMLAREAGQQEVKLSAHAEKRLHQQKINLSPGDLQNIGRALKMAAAKGSRDSLILYGDLALVASVTNRTVVTALGSSEQNKEQVFTNIDSAVIIKK
jgi:flagellar operon protein